MRFLSSKAWFLIVGFLISVPALNFRGISLAYLVLLIGALTGIFQTSKELSSSYVLTISILVVISYQTAFPIEDSFWLERFTTKYFFSPTKFGESFLAQNFAIALKFFIATVCLSLIFARARKFGRTNALSGGFLSGALTSAILSFFNIRQGDTGYLISTGLAKGSTDFGLICSSAILLTLSNTKLSFLSKLVIRGTLFVAIMLSGSRGALLLTLIILSVYTMIRSTPAQRVYFALFSVFLGIVAATLMNLLQNGLGFSEALRVRVFTGGESLIRSDQYRTNLREQALNDFSESPIFGVGFRTLTNGHLVPLQVLAAGGLVLFISFCYFIYIAANKFKFKAYTPVEFCYLAFLLGSFLTQNQVDVPFIYFAFFLLRYSGAKER